jgi:hypothetical protein
VSSFSDQLMIRYLDAASVDTLLVPTADTARQRARALLAQVFEPRLLAVESVDAITVTAKQFQVPIVEPITVRGTWERLIPQSERAVADAELSALSQVNWVDMALNTTVAVRVSMTSALLDSISSADVSELSQQDFLARFQFLDLANLMEAAKVTTYGELQADFPQLYRLHYADPPVLDPNDPRFQRSYPLRVSALIFPTLDLEGALRRLIQSRHALDAIRPHAASYEGGDLLASSAWMGIFPTSVFDPSVTPVTQEQVSSLFAAEGFVAAFETV